MWIKICGTTSLADAQHAANSGASAIGFVLAPSPRRVTVDQVRAIAPHLPRNVERYGVFVDAGFDEIVTAVRDADLTGVQLHTNDDPDLPRRLRAHFAAEESSAPISILAVLAYSDDMEPQIETIARHAARYGAIASCYQAGLANFMPFKYTVLVLVVVGAVLIFVGAAWGPETKDVDFGAMSPPDASH